MVRFLQSLFVLSIFGLLHLLPVGPALERLPFVQTHQSLSGQDMAIYPHQGTDICVLRKRHRIVGLQIWAHQDWVLSQTACQSSYRPLTPTDHMVIGQNDQVSGALLAQDPFWRSWDFVQTYIFWFCLAAALAIWPIRRIPRVDDVNRTLFRSLKHSDRIIMLSLMYLAKCQTRLNEDQIELIVEAGQAYGLKGFDYDAFVKTYDSLPHVGTLEPVLKLTKHSGAGTREAILHAAVQFFIAAGRPTVLERKHYAMLVRILRCNTQRAVGQFQSQAQQLSLG